MKSNSIRLCLLSALLLAFSTAVTYAAHTSDLLRDAYMNLATAKSDYGGHRVKAMNELEETGKILGVEVRSTEKPRESQRESDAQLRDARRLLEEARTGLSEHDRGRVEKHVSEAIREIDAALRTK